MPTLTRRQHKAQFFFALGHPRRIKLVEILTEHPSGITYEALKIASGIPEASLSHHLRFLRDANLTLRTIQGRHSFYRLNSEVLKKMCTPPAFPNRNVA